jgi:hypothetical protein
VTGSTELKDSYPFPHGYTAERLSSTSKTMTTTASTNVSIDTLIVTIIDTTIVIYPCPVLTNSYSKGVLIKVYSIVKEGVREWGQKY